MPFSRTERDMLGKQLTIFGGSGFVGRNLIQKLASFGASIKVGVRDFDKAHLLRMMGEVGQIVPIKVNMLNSQEIANLCEGSAVVINLVGTLAERTTQAFRRTHVETAQSLAKSCARVGTRRLVHVSALGASLNSQSKYAMSKAEGEQAILENFPSVTILRPSIIFGPGDQFFSRLALVARLSPVMLSFGTGKTKFQPIYVGDVSNAIIKVLNSPSTEGLVYELVGPATMTFDEILRRACSGRRRITMHIPFGIGRFLGQIFELLPGRLLTRDQVVLLEQDSVMSQACKGVRNIADLGIAPVDIDFILSSHLGKY